MTPVASRAVALAFGLATFAVPSVALAYVGPGAGFAVVTTAFVLVLSILVLVFGSLFWPFRLLWASWLH